MKIISHEMAWGVFVAATAANLWAATTASDEAQRAHKTAQVLMEQGRNAEAATYDALAASNETVRTIYGLMTLGTIGMAGYHFKKSINAPTGAAGRYENHFTRTYREPDDIIIFHRYRDKQ